MLVSGPKLEIPDYSLLDMLRKTAQTYPNRRATLFADQALSYTQLLKAVETLMGQLQKRGIQQGDRIGIMLPNCPQYVIAYYAITGLGAVVVQVNPISAAPELEFLLSDSGTARLVVFDQLLPLVRQVQSRTPLQELYVVRFGESNQRLGATDAWFDQLLTASQPAAPVSFDPMETVAVLQYTGGTTGRSKGAMLTHRNLVANAVQTGALTTGTPEDTMICALPLFHVYAMTVCMNYAIHAGMSMLIMTRFQPAELLELIKTWKPTLFPGVPTMYVALSQVIAPGSDVLQCLRICNSGGAPMPEKVLTEFERVTGALVLEGYGLSEASPVTHGNLLGHRKIGSIGMPMPNTDSRVVDVADSSKTLAAGEIGELAIRGPQIMKGYWNRPDETAKTIVDGWLLTGDIARMDEDGYTYIVDRKKDMIIASGYNVYPRDVEEVLYKHPAVLEAAVIGIPDDYRGETVKAFVVCKSGQSVTVDELQAHCRANLAAYKVPHVFEFRTELPKTGVGKVLRRALRQTS